jgi:GGDEF domain-containing protein
VSDVTADIRTIQELFLASSLADGIVVYEDGKYLGFLDARSILAAVSEKDLVDARDQNPLTKLPGNARLDAYMGEACENAGIITYLCYFDFNDFKPFNDRYGFRRGDRVILLFADILRDYASRNGWFIAHIGGDDFFAGIPFQVTGCEGLDGRLKTESQLREVLNRFAGSVVSFYDEQDRANGWIEAIDRSDNLRRFPMLSVSVGVLRVCVDDGLPGEASLQAENLGEVLASLKKKAKMSGGFAYQEGIVAALANTRLPEA